MWYLIEFEILLSTNWSLSHFEDRIKRHFRVIFESTSTLSYRLKMIMWWLFFFNVLNLIISHDLFCIPIQDIKAYLIQQRRQHRKNFIEDQKLCSEINAKYKPFGLENGLPPDLLTLCASTNSEYFYLNSLR